MHPNELEKLCKKAEPKSLILMRVDDDREVVPATAWVDDQGLLVIEEQQG